MAHLATMSIDDVRARDKAAISTLYTRYRLDVLRYLRGWLRDHALAEDLTSETFIRALAAAPRLCVDTADLLPWLRTIARNLVRDHAKAARQRHEFVTATLPDEGDRSADPVLELILNSDAHYLRLAVGELTHEQRSCLMHRFVDEYSVAHTATLMRRDVRAIRALQYRAIKRVKTMLASDEPSWSVQ